MPKKELKPKERAVLDYIIRTIRETNYSPSVRDIAGALNFKSTSTVQMYINRLEEYGYLHRDEGKSRSLRVDAARLAPHRHIPILGKVTAGVPVQAIENYEGYLDFFVDSKKYNVSEVFALRVSGESMINAGILDGDYVIVEQGAYAENGDIVVAMIDEETTVKTFYKENGHYRLQPENATMTPILVKELLILGKVICSVRFYS